jgi:membrane-associated phospholipid phosphatase
MHWQQLPQRAFAWLDRLLRRPVPGIPAAAPHGWRTWFAIATAALVAMIGISRILLGVHYISDVIGGWAIGISGWA